MSENTKTIKKVIPVKGNLRAKFLKELKGSQSTDNVIKEPLKSPQDNKIIIEKVETVKIEVITNSSKPRRISSLFTSLDDQNSATPEENIDPPEVFRVEPLQTVEENARSTASQPQINSLKLISAKMPENECNASVPLKMIRKFKPLPKPKPNLMNRIHRVQTSKPPEPPALVDFTTCPLDSGVKFEILVPDVVMVEEVRPHEPEVPIHVEEDFCGFDEVTAKKTFDLGLWGEILRLNSKDDAIEVRKTPPSKQKVEPSVLKSPPKVVKAIPERIFKNEEDPKCIFVESYQMQSNSPKKQVPVAKTKENIPPPLMTSTPHPVKCMPSTSQLPSSSKSCDPGPSTSKSSEIENDENFQLNEEWMEDIAIVIGTSRIAKIDESLKNIPSLITGNFSAIETENVEFKLIIKHLLRELGVDSILDTVNIPVPNVSNPMPMPNDYDDDDDDFSEGFDDDSNDPSNYPDENSQVQTIEDDNCRNSSDVQSNFMSMATSFGNIPPLSPSEHFSVIDETTVTPAEVVQTPINAQSDAPLVKSEESENLKRKKGIEIVSEPPTKKPKKDRKLPWSLLVDGEVRRNSLRSSSCDSGSETTKDSRNAKKVAEKLHQNSNVKSESPKSQKVIQTSLDVPKDKTEAIYSPVVQNLFQEIRSPPLRPLVIQTTLAIPPENLPASPNPPESPATSRRSSRFNSPAVSSRGDSPAPPSPVTIKRQRKKKSLFDPSEEESDKEVIQRPRRSKPLKPLSDDSEVEEAAKKSSSDSDVPLVRKTSRSVTNSGRGRGRPAKNKKIEELKRIDDDSSSISSEISEASRQKVLKSRLETFDAKPSRKNGRRATDKNANFSKLENGFDEDTPVKVTNGVSRGNSSDESSVASHTKTSKKLNESSSKKPPTSTRKRRSRKGSEVPEITKKVFTQEPLEAAIESQVPYDEILQSIKSSAFGKRLGRVSLQLSKEDQIRREENFKKLKELQFFRCGSCGFDVSKHEWTKHFLSHGGLAWIESFDAPLHLNDWNEALRRTINAFKIYKQASMQCPHCGEEKRSALGHLTHVFTCGESEEAIEEKKMTCVNCTERYLPFHASAHRTKCTGMTTVVPYSNEVGEQESEKEEDSSEFNVSGRQKRKAVKKAEKKFKKILENINDESDQLKVVNGQIKCHICGEDNFESQKEALEHIKNEHKSGGDFEGSDSDASAAVDEESDESDGSSGVESSDFEGSDDGRSDCSYGEKRQRLRKGKISATEPVEVKNARSLITDYVETVRGKSMSSKTIAWTKEILKSKWKIEFLPQEIPRLLASSPQDPKTILPSLNFNFQSMFFDVHRTDNYSLKTKISSKSWKQLEIGESDSSTIYCGGSVAALDWAPSNSDVNFLAVACNNEMKGININLPEPMQSCVQVYEVQNLLNENSKISSESIHLNYVLLIDKGPIWSIKFHPSHSNLQNRIGILAVATSDQSVLVFSLPNFSGRSPTVLSIAPNFVCKLKKTPMFFNQKFLQQTTRLTWFVTNDNETLLGAGFVSGLVAVWNISNISEGESEIYPEMVIPAHTQPITCIDFKATEGSSFHLLTASFDRLLKVFTIDGARYQEDSSYFSASRVLLAEWWLHWPGYVIGYDDCFSTGSITHRQPMEFGSRNTTLLPINNSIVHFNINQWVNSIVFASDSGDIFSCQPRQMLLALPKDKWNFFNFTMLSSTDSDTVTINGKDETVIVFSDYKNATRQPKSYRQAPTDRINELLINQVCFNRNEKSYRFYALGYETGFVRIRYLKNSE